MGSFTVQLFVILATFGAHCSVIAKSLSQRTSSKDEASCVVEGDAHPVNSSFITSDCSLRCYCMTGGVASCMDLCPHISPIECPPGRTLKEEERPVVSGGVRCSCRRRFCVPEKVLCYDEDKGEKYKVGETFNLTNCSKTCSCNENGQISCVSMCPKISCPKGTRPKRNGEIQLGDKCSCVIQECVPVPRSFCYVDGRRYRRGRVFITKDCRLKCRCRKNGKPRCTQLCKTKRKAPQCGPDERLAEVLELSAGGRCSCEKKICLSNFINNWTESKFSNLEGRNI